MVSSCLADCRPCAPCAPPSAFAPPSHAHPDTPLALLTPLRCPPPAQPHLSPHPAPHNPHTSSTHLGIALGVGGPQDDDLVNPRALLEVPNLLAHDLHLLGLGALDQVVRALLLVGSNELGVVDACSGPEWEGHDWVRRWRRRSADA